MVEANFLGDPGGVLEGLYRADIHGLSKERGRVLAGVVAIVDETIKKINEYTKREHCSSVVDEIRSAAYTRIEDFLREYTNMWLEAKVMESNFHE